MHVNPRNHATMPLDLSIFRETAKAAGEEKIHSITSLSGSSGALLFSMLPGPCLLVCPSEASAAVFYTDTVFWSKLLNTTPPVLIHPGGHPGRLKSLVQLYEQDGGKVIASVDASVSTIWRRDEFPSVNVTRGLTLDRDVFIRRLHDQGYYTVPMVSREGEMSVRGGIIDVFPPDREQPVRVEFFGDEIESLRFFDIDTQLSVGEIHEIRICPATEPGSGGADLFDFLSGSRLILNEPDDIKRRCPGLDRIFMDRKILSFRSLPLEGDGFKLPVNSAGGFGILREERKTMEDLVERVNELKGRHYILMVCSSEVQSRRLKDLFFDKDTVVPVFKGSAATKYAGSPVITIGELSKGFKYRDVIVLAERDIFGRRPVFRPVKKSRVSGLISSVEDFREGDYVVHVDHGIGIFAGTRKERIGDYEGDFITIEYLGGDKLFVPFEHINCVRKYHAPENVRPVIDKLGGRTWRKTRRKVRRKIKDMAEKLLKIYAGRSSVRGHAFSADTELHREFDGFFAYEETPDQLTSINEIKRDMEEPFPMDRLLCGDVGYGKTEVVMRACFKAVYDSKQVAVLVPTTILAEQHYETFVSRFSAFPVRIDFLSRFKSPAERKRTLRSLAQGDTDIIIGTHTLLGRDVKFYDLGLLVIDEEHKFGVTHKEKIKAVKTNVDVLTLSATPIPRTLHMALSGIRAMSTIETPPEDRIAVRSAVARFNPRIIREALRHELDRDGQAFFVHNRIHDIYRMANFLRELMPEGRIGVAHGRMRAKELEEVMRAFFHGEINILVSTAIIGSGLDIPSANTIIINRADMFGLADLYQLRGRVGRSNVTAYAYFLIPGEDAVTEEARKKLQAIQELGYLGAGFRLALKDLEIRGAGNLLGAEQSGHIEAVGFDMYMEMLESAVAELKGEKRTPVIEPVLDLKVTAVIPDDYIENPDLRLSIYRKIVSAKDTGSLRGLLEELKDRFGTPPEKTKRLLEITELKMRARNLSVTRIQNTDGRIKILFAPGTTVAPERIFALHETRKGRIRFLPEGGLELDMRGRKWDEISGELKNVLDALA